MNESGMYDDFSRDYDRFVDWESRLSIELPFLKKIIGQIQLESGHHLSILDAACGTGQHAVALAREGFHCIGADFSAEMVSVARENAQRAGLSLTFQQAGFGQFTQTFGKARFDGIICLGNSLPHLLNEASLTKAMTDFAAVLKPDGIIILQNRNFDLVLAERARWMPPQTFRENDETWVFARFYDFEADGRLSFNIQVLYSDGRAAFEQRVISTRLWPMKKALLEKYLLMAGFRNLSFFGNLAGDPFEPALSANLVIIAQQE